MSKIFLSPKHHLFEYYLINFLLWEEVWISLVWARGTV